MVFLVAAVASALLYAVWVNWVPLLPSNLYIPLLDLGKITGYSWPSALEFLLIVAGLYGSYVLGYRAIARDSSSISRAAIFAPGALFCVELLGAYPATAADVFGYISHGRLLALHGANPFVTTPLEFAGDAIIPFLAYPSEPSQYGPAWVLLGGAFASLAHGNLLADVLLYKLAAAAAHVGGAVMVYLIAGHLAEARAAKLSAYLYLWNPLLLWEMVANAHNDGVMMFFGLLAVWLFVSGFELVVLMAVAAGALVKAPLALIAPALFGALWRRGWPRAVEALFLGLALAVAVYHPFWEGGETLTALRRGDLFTASIGSLVRLALLPALGEADASTLARTVSLSAFAVVVVIALLFAIRGRTDMEVLTAVYVTLLAGLLLATSWFQAWYVAWPLAIGAALGSPTRHLEVALLSLGGLLQYVVFIYFWMMGIFPGGDSLPVQCAAYLLIVGPLVVGLVLQNGPQRRARLALRRA